jgi:hypothetical protein
MITIDRFGLNRFKGTRAMLLPRSKMHEVRHARPCWEWAFLDEEISSARFRGIGPDLRAAKLESIRPSAVEPATASERPLANTTGTPHRIRSS